MYMTFTKPLLGKQAQRTMASPHRIFSLLTEDPQGAKDSAVMVLLTPVNEGLTKRDLLDWEVLLIRRNTYPGAHSGQIALPGGRAEADDPDLWATACRETFEEVGIREETLERIGPLTSLYVPVSNFMIYPFLAVNHTACKIVPDRTEVADYKYVPLKVLNPAQAVERNLKHDKRGFLPAPSWQYEDYTIWGATAMILAELYQLIDQEDLIPA